MGPADSVPEQGFWRIIDEYYPVILEQLAPLNYPYICSNCEASNGRLLCCHDCIDHRLFCAGCLCHRHNNTPFHRISEWSTEWGCYLPSSLAAEGLVIRLHHRDGTECRSEGHEQKFNILHTNGMHPIRTVACGCHTSSSNQGTFLPAQLMSNQLFPATWDAPATAYTFAVLDLYDELNLAGHINVKQFCDGLKGITPDILGFGTEVWAMASSRDVQKS